MSYIILYAIFHLICAALFAGIFFAYFQAKFPNIAEEDRREDLGQAWGMGLLFGPISLIVEIFMSGFVEHGVRWR